MIVYSMAYTLGVQKLIKEIEEFVTSGDTVKAQNCCNFLMQSIGVCNFLSIILV